MERASESSDALFDGALWIAQSRRGSRFSIDSLLLAGSVAIEGGAAVVDLGCGNAVVSLALTHFYRPERVVGIEVQSSLAERARRNVRGNGLDDRIDIVEADVRAIPGAFGPALAAASFDVAVCNPPYYPASDGRINPSRERAAARHELMGSLDDFVRAAGRLLRHRGRLVLVYPAFRVGVMLDTLAKGGFSPSWVRFVHPRAGQDATLVLAEAAKGGSLPLRVRPGLIVHETDGYTSAVAALIGGRPLDVVATDADARGSDVRCPVSR